MNDRLFRSVNDRVLAGVAGGMAEMWDLDPSLVRIGWVVLTPLTAGFAILVYIVMAIVVPEDVPGARPAAVAPDISTSWTTPAGTGPAAASSFAPPLAGPVSTDPTGLEPTRAPAAGPIPASTMAPGPVPAAGGPAPGSSAWSDNRRADRDRRRAERHAERAARRAERGRGPGSGAIVGGLILILLGGGVLASELLPDFDWHTAWPVGLIAIGVLLVLGSMWPRQDRT